MDLVDTIFTKIGLPKEDWLLDVDNYEQQELLTKNKLISSYKIKEKNFNINYTARIYNVNMTKYSKFEETDLPLMLQIGSQLKHLSILQIKGFSPINFKHKKNPVLFTEFVSNGNLSNLFEKQRKITNLNLMSDTKKLINIYGIASGMKYIHSQDIIHCQLQTSSIFLDSNLYPKIFEFGHSQKVSKPQQQTKYSPTTEPSFIAPEIWERKGFTKSSDVYAFGMIVYEIILNKKPLQKSKNLTKIMNDVVNKGYRPELDKSMPKCYQDLIKSCWSSQLDKRPTFSDIVELLKTNRDFITEKVDEFEYLQYINMVDPQEEKKSDAETGTKTESIQSIEKVKEQSNNNNGLQINFKCILSNFNNFNIIAKIGEGGFSKIYRVKNLVNKKNYAAKVYKFMIDSETFDSYEAICLFREVILMSKLNHPSILKLIEFSLFNFEGDPLPTVILELGTNGSLRDILQMEMNGLSPAEWNNTKKLINIYGIAHGMKYLHSLDIIHRDLKPENVLMDDYLFPKIIDFGLSKELSPIQSFMAIKSQGGIKGTPIYMAPEVFSNEKYSKKSDVYSFAIVVYEILTLKEPFKNFSVLELLKKIAIDGFRPEIPSDVPSFYIDLINRCWSQNPEDRPSFAEIVELLETDDFLLENIDNSEFFDYVDYIKSSVAKLTPNEELQFTTISELYTDKRRNKIIIFPETENDMSAYQKIEVSFPEINPSISQTNEVSTPEINPSKSQTNEVSTPDPDHFLSNDTPNRFQKIKIDFSKLDKSKEIIVSASIPKINLNEYDKDEKLGSGGFANVYKIRNKTTQETYAAKILKKKKKYISAEEVLNIMREVTILPKVNYESIIKFIGYSLTNFSNKKRTVFVTELAENGSLNDILELERKGCAIDGWDDTKKLINIYGIACGMKYLHSCSILHRDLKPDNILLDDYLYPKITDFGFSRPYKHNINQISEHETNVYGTAPYISPEIWRSFDHTCASDVYAFAFIVYEIMTLERPLRCFPDFYLIMHQVANNHYRPPFKFPIPDCYRKLIESCWSEDKNSRPSFYKIVEELKTNPEFITESVDLDEFISYTEMIGEDYPINKDTEHQQKKHPTKIKNKVSIPHTSKMITELTISTFQKIIESKKDVPSFNDYIVNLDNFEQGKIISKGEFSKVFKVVEKVTNKEFAARLSNVDMNQFSEKEMQSISNEMKTISLIQHPCILKFVGFSPTSFKNESKPVVITELLKTKPLKEFLLNERTKGFVVGWNSTTKLKTIYGIASAINCLHSHDVIHRNLNPSNILMTKSFYPKLSEFGLCTHLLIMNSVTFRSTNLINSSPVYSAPEILCSNEGSKASDVYSFGMIVFEIMAIEKPFKNLLNFSQVYEEVVNKENRPALSIDIPESYRKLIEVCWQQNPDKRPKLVEIIDALKNDQGFITKDVEKDSYLKYVNKIEKNKDPNHHHHHKHHCHKLQEQI